MYRTSVYTLVNGDMQWLTHQKQQKLLKGDIIQQHIDIDRRCDGEWYHLFLIFAVFDVSLIACRR